MYRTEQQAQWQIYDLSSSAFMRQMLSKLLGESLTYVYKLDQQGSVMYDTQSLRAKPLKILISCKKCKTERSKQFRSPAEMIRWIIRTPGLLIYSLLWLIKALWI